jgi:hypothetical protein
VDSTLYLRGTTDFNHYIKYSSVPDGPDIAGYGGVRLGYTGGGYVERLRVNSTGNFLNGTTIVSNGNVGIGTTTPGSKLEVYQGNIFVNNAGGGLYTGLLGGDSTTYAGLIFRKDGTRHAGLKWDGTKLILQDASASATDPDIWSGTNVMTWDVSNGRVGINTTAPQAPLHVQYLPGNQGTIAIFGSEARVKIIDEGDNLPSGIAAIGPVYGLGLYASSGPLRFFTGGTGTINERVRIDTSGNVGIGTTSPGGKLHVIATSSTSGLVISNDTVARSFAYWDATNNRLVIQVA